MTLRELAPTLFVGLFVLAGVAIVGEIVLVVSRQVTRAQGKESPEGDGSLVRLHRILRVVAPASLLGAGGLLAWLSLSPGVAPRATDEASSTSVHDTEPAASGASVAIDSAGIGAAAVGMTLGELRAALSPTAATGDPNDRFMVDVTALPVVEGTDTLYHLLFPIGTTIDADTPLELAATTHARARTADGVGPGTILGVAAERYGEPTLSYSVYDESREYARFPEQPGDRILFRVTPPPGLSSLAGSYPSEGEYNETTVFDPEARIFMVLVRLRAEATSGAAPPP